MPFPQTRYSLEFDGDKTIKDCNLLNATLNIRLATPLSSDHHTPVSGTIHAPESASIHRMDEHSQEGRDQEDYESIEDTGAMRRNRRAHHITRTPWRNMPRGQTLGAERSLQQSPPLPTETIALQDHETTSLQRQLEERRRQALNAFQDRAAASLVSPNPVSPASITQRNNLISLRSIALNQVIGIPFIIFTVALIKTAPDFRPALTLPPDLASLVLNEMDPVNATYVSRIRRLSAVLYNLQLNKVPESAVKEAFLSWGMYLKTCWVSATNIVSRESWDAIWSCESMEKLHIQESVAVLPPTHVIPSLKTLELINCALSRCKSTRILSMFPNLEVLSLRGCVDPSPDLLSVTGKLRIRSMDLCRLDMDVRLDGDSFECLETLDVSGTRTNRLDFPKSISRLYLANTSIPPDALFSLKMFTRLVEVKLPSRADTRMDEITANAFTNLAIARLDLEGASKLTDSGLMDLACKYEALNHLNLVGTRITDLALGKIGKFLRLKELYLDRTAVCNLTSLAGMCGD